MQVKKFCGFNIHVKEKKPFNQCERRVVYTAKSRSKIEKLTEALADQKAINIDHMKIMKNGEVIETQRYINTVDKPDLAPVVRTTS